MTDRITWEPTRYAGYDGYILGHAKNYKAKIKVFSIAYTSSRGDIKAGTPYLLAHRLPFRGVERKFGSHTEAQKHAERYLVWAFELMGFVPKSEDTSTDGRRYETEETSEGWGVIRRGPGVDTLIANYTDQEAADKLAGQLNHAAALEV